MTFGKYLTCFAVREGQLLSQTLQQYICQCRAIKIWFTTVIGDMYFSYNTKSIIGGCCIFSYNTKLIIGGYCIFSYNTKLIASTLK